MTSWFGNLKVLTPLASTLKGHPSSRALVGFAEPFFSMDHRPTTPSNSASSPTPKSIDPESIPQKAFLHANLCLRTCLLGKPTSKPRRHWTTAMKFRCEETMIIAVPFVSRQPRTLSSWSGSFSVIVFNSIFDNWIGYIKCGEESEMWKEHWEKCKELELLISETGEREKTNSIRKESKFLV